MTMFVMRVLLFAAEALAVSTFLPLLVFALAQFSRRRAALRHFFWLAAFAMLLALPLLALTVPSHVLLAQTPLENTIADMPAVPVTVAIAAPVAATYVRSWDMQSILALLFAPICAVWIAGVCWNLLRLGLGTYGLRRLRAGSEAFDTIQGCDVRLAAGGPLTYGWLSPVILLPHAARGWTQARLDAVLRHELAHVRRKDSLTQTLAQLVCAFYWPNPLVWLAARGLRREAEIAADDTVLASGLRASDYAAQLLQLAGETRGRPRFAGVAMIGVAMAAPSALESRVTSVLSSTSSRQGVTAMEALKIVCLGVCATALLAAARPSFAETRPAAPQPALLAPVPMSGPALTATPDDPAAPPIPPVATVVPPVPPVPPVPVRRHVRVVIDGKDLPPAELDAMIDRAERRADAAIERAQNRIKAASDRALSPERVEEIVTQTERHVADAGRRHAMAMQRMADADARADTRVETRTTGPGSQSSAQSSSSTSGDGVQESVRQTMVQTRPDMAHIEAEVRMQVKQAVAEARVMRDVALANAHAEIAAAIAQAREEARASLKAQGAEKDPEPPAKH